MASLAQDGKKRVDAFEPLLAAAARGAAVAADLEIFLDRHAREEAAALGHERDAMVADAVRRDAGDVDRRRCAARRARPAAIRRWR